jgi:pyruvate/2-oxoglutarate dehydrogenase complex dihydrolipoamide acyltransferase (E2) component
VAALASRGFPGRVAPTHLAKVRDRPHPIKKEFAIVTNLIVPKTGGMNTTKVNVVRWLKSEGDKLQRGEPVVELETEKVSYELDSPTEGVLLKIVEREPAEVDVGGVLGYIGQPGDAVPSS